MFSLKIIFWLRTKRKSLKLLLRSLVRNFSMYDMHDAPSPNDLFFWKISNFTNIVIWTSLVVAATITIFTATIN